MDTKSPGPAAVVARLLAGALALAAAPAARAQLPAWDSGGPPLYQTNSVAVPLDEDTLVYAAASIYDAMQSAVYGSHSGGSVWDPLLEAPRGTYFSEVFIDPADPGRLLAAALGTTETHVYLSTDAGDTWADVETVEGSCVTSFAAVPASTVLLLACGNRVRRSGDGGHSWTLQSVEFAESVRLTAGSGTLYAYGPTRIYRASASAVSWTEVASAPPACPSLGALRVDPENANTLLAGTGRLGAGGFDCGGVFRSSNAGATWSANLLPEVYVSDIAVDPDDSSRIYASASHFPGLLPPGGVYETADGGATWHNLRVPASSVLRLALSRSGRNLYAATPLGVFRHVVRKTLVVGPR